MSRIGKKPIQIPQGVKVQIQEKKVAVEGPKGKLNYTLPYVISAENKYSKIVLTRAANSKQQRANVNGASSKTRAVFGAYLVPAYPASCVPSSSVAKRA